MIISRRLASPAAAFALALGCSGLASADPVPPGVVSGSMQLGTGAFVGGLPVTQSTNNSFSAPTSFAATANGGPAFAAGTLGIVESPVPGLFAHAVLYAPPTGNSSADIRASEFYAFQVLGPGATADVHIDALGHVGIAAISVLGAGDFVSASSFFQVREANNGPEVVQGSLGVFGDAHGFQDDAFPGVYVASPFHNLLINSVFSLRTNTIYEVRLRSIIHGVSDAGATTDVFADIDPTFTVDGPYSFQFSEGFGGGIVRAAGVPEPAAWATLLLGFAGIGAMIRGRRGLSARPTAA